MGELHSSPGIIRVIKLRRMKSAGYVACMGGEMHAGFWCGDLSEWYHLEDPGVDMEDFI